MEIQNEFDTWLSTYSYKAKEWNSLSTTLKIWVFAARKIEERFGVTPIRIGSVKNQFGAFNNFYIFSSVGSSKSDSIDMYSSEWKSKMPAKDIIVEFNGTEKELVKLCHYLGAKDVTIKDFSDNEDNVRGHKRSLGITCYAFIRNTNGIVSIIRSVRFPLLLFKSIVKGLEFPDIILKTKGKNEALPKNDNEINPLFVSLGVTPRSKKAMALQRKHGIYLCELASKSGPNQICFVDTNIFYKGRFTFYVSSDGKNYQRIVPHGSIGPEGLRALSVTVLKNVNPNDWETLTEKLVDISTKFNKMLDPKYKDSGSYLKNDNYLKIDDALRSEYGYNFIYENGNIVNEMLRNKSILKFGSYSEFVRLHQAVNEGYDEFNDTISEGIDLFHEDGWSDTNENVQLIEEYQVNEAEVTSFNASIKFPFITLGDSFRVSDRLMMLRQILDNKELFGKGYYSESIPPDFEHLKKYADIARGLQVFYIGEEPSLDLMNKMIGEKTIPIYEGLEELNEGKTITVKRRYTDNYPAQSVGVHAPVRNQILEFIDRRGSVSYRQLKNYFTRINEETGKMPNFAWVKRHSHLIDREIHEGQVKYSLTKRGQRIISEYRNYNTKNMLRERAKSREEGKEPANDVTIDNPDQIKGRDAGATGGMAGIPSNPA